MNSPLCCGARLTMGIAWKRSLKTLAFALIASACVTLPLAWVLTQSENARFSENQRAGIIDSLSMARADLEVILNSRLLLIRSLSVYVSIHPDISSDDFDSLAKVIVDSQPGILAVQLAKDNVITHVYPMFRNDGIPGLRLLWELPQEQLPAIKRVVESRQTVVAGPVRLLQGGMGIIYRNPVFIANRGNEHEADAYWGLSTIIVDSDIVFREAGLSELKNARLVIRGKDGLGEQGEVIFGDSAVFQENPVKFDVVLPGGSWQLAAVPVAGWTASPDLRTIWGLSTLMWLSVGLVLWGLLRYPLKLRTAVAEATLAIRAAKDDLEFKVTERTEDLRSANARLQEEAAQRTLANEALGKSEEQFRTLVQNAPDAIFIQIEERFAYVNEAAVRLYGAASENELLGRDIVERIHPDYRGEIFKRIRSINEGAEPHPPMEQKQLKLDGTIIYVEASATSIRYRMSKGAIVFVRDITERKKAGESLLLSEDKYRRLFEDAVLGIFRSTPEGKLIDVNPAYARMFGFDSPEEAKSQVNDVAVDLYADPSRRTEIVRLISDAGGPISAENRYRRKNGDLFTGNLHAWTVRDGEGKLLYLEGFIEDITERREAEAERLRLEKAIEQIAEGVMISDANFIVQYVNPAFEKITGYGRSEIIGQAASIIKSDKYDGALYRKIYDTLKGGEAWSGRVQAMKKAGTVYEVEALTSPVRDESGTITNYISVSRDITREVRLESELQQAHKMEAIGTLAGGIAHDFNNLLAPIIGYAEMTLLNTPDLGPVRHGLEQILNAGIRAGDLVKQILAFSRFTPRQEMIPVEIDAVAIEALKLLRSSLPTTIEIRQNIENGAAIANATQIHQVMLNLCTNAAHAMDGRGVLEVSLSRVDLSESDLADQSIVDLEPGPHLKLCVSDTGSGMDAATLERIFDPYFTTREVGKGSGLGLAIVHGVIKRHGGAVTVRSELGKGTTFSVFIPATEAGAGPPVEAGVELPRGTERILLIDDERIVVEMETAILEQLGYKVTPRTDSMLALEIFRSRPCAFDLVMTDYTMPKLTGLDLFKEIHQTRPDIPIILCTGFSEKITPEGLTDLGVELVMKPFSMKQIAESIHKVLRARES